MPVTLEMRSPGAPKWRLHPIPVPEGSTSSFSSQGPDITEMYVMGYRDFPGVWVARGGATIDKDTLLGQAVGIGTRRLIVDLSGKGDNQGLDLVADLRQGPCQLFVWLKGVQLEYRIRLADIPEDVSRRQTIEAMVNERQHELLNMYLEMEAFGGHGDEAAEDFRRTVDSLQDHDLRHFWLEERCPCNEHLSN